MQFDRFDILSAYYLFGRDYHNGQFSKEYKYMGRCIKMGFSPGCISLTSDAFGYESLTDNGQEIYRHLMEGLGD
jgi:hypothetical protein